MCCCGETAKVVVVRSDARSLLLHCLFSAAATGIITSPSQGKNDSSTSIYMCWEHAVSQERAQLTEYMILLSLLLLLLLSSAYFAHAPDDGIQQYNNSSTEEYNSSITTAASGAQQRERELKPQQAICMVRAGVWFTCWFVWLYK